MQNVKHILQSNNLGTVSGIRANQELNVKKHPMSSNSQDLEKMRKLIDRNFLKFGAFYGQLWRSQLKNDDYLGFMKNEWLQGLQHIEEGVIEQTIIYCRDNKEYPPTLASFIDLCKTAKKKHSFVRAEKVEGKRKTSEVALKHLKDIKARLHMNTK